MPGFLSVSLDSVQNPSRLKYTKPQNGVQLDANQLQLKSDLDRVESEVRNTFKKDTQIRHDLLVRLREIAEEGLVGENADVASGGISLVSYCEEDLVRAAVSTRESYIAEHTAYVKVPLIVGGILIIIWLFAISKLTYIHAFFERFPAGDINWAVNAVGAAGFALIGLLLSVNFLVRYSNRVISYDTIGKIRRYQFSVPHLFNYLYLLMALVGLALYFDIVQLGIAHRLLNDIKENPFLGVLVGIIIGLAEPTVASLVSSWFDPKVQRESTKKDQFRS